MNDYQAVYEDLFVKNLRRYSSIKNLAKKKIDRVLSNPYHNTKFLGDPSEKLKFIEDIEQLLNRNFKPQKPGPKNKAQ
ncbi:MAG: hypothetical protein U9N77_16810 [Thermodesulfobacteriota bacterium]|nr:hypothetical protein [Thermodesulfobacteriota bacterium]